MQALTEEGERGRERDKGANNRFCMLSRKEKGLMYFPPLWGGGDGRERWGEKSIKRNSLPYEVVSLPSLNFVSFKRCIQIIITNILFMSLLYRITILIFWVHFY